MQNAIISAAAGMAIGAGANGQGFVRAWGDNFWGPNCAGQSIVPADLGPCTAVAAGGGHTVAIHTDGTVRAWGFNGSGETNVPADLGPCTAVAAGGNHTVALRTDGTVRAWGWNAYGQCTIPADLGACTAVAAGGWGAHTVAIRTDGTVRAWGWNAYGQCTIPADLGPCTAVAAGGFHTVAIRTDGTVRAWGDNGSGESKVPADLGPCTAVAACYSHTVALRTDGAVRAWGGDNYWGQCTIPADLGACTAVAAGYAHTVALRTDGTVRAWGWNIYGQSRVPADLGPCTAVAAGGLHTVALAAPASAQCVADLNRDGLVDGADLGILLNDWGQYSNGNLPCTGADLNADGSVSGSVDGADLGILLAAWGNCPGPVVPSWATLIEAQPDPAVVTDPALRAAIEATGLAWRVRDTATQIEMLLIPPGTFQMGCITGSALYGCSSSELPVHQVMLTNAFYLGRYEVTQAQWRARMGSNPSYFQSASAQVPAAQVPSRPVEQVSWDATQGFLSATGMRLPTEAEWEYACRAGTVTGYHSTPTSPDGTNDPLEAQLIGWIYYNTGPVGDWSTRPVGIKPSNSLGLHDMSGNVNEWVSDWYAEYEPQQRIDPTGAVVGSDRVLRGGSIDGTATQARSSFRQFNGPASFGADIGFRVARNP
jgi:formylglycine-generating enzyme required for sulfatase activity